MAPLAPLTLPTHREPKLHILFAITTGALFWIILLTGNTQASLELDCHLHSFFYPSPSLSVSLFFSSRIRQWLPQTICLQMVLRQRTSLSCIS